MIKYTLTRKIQMKSETHKANKSMYLQALCQIPSTYYSLSFEIPVFYCKRNDLYNKYKASVCCFSDGLVRIILKQYTINEIIIKTGINYDNPFGIAT